MLSQASPLKLAKNGALCLGSMTAGGGQVWRLCRQWEVVTLRFFVLAIDLH